MNKRFVILSILIVIFFSACNNTMNEVNILCVTANIDNKYYSDKYGNKSDIQIGNYTTLHIYTYVGETFTCSYNFFPKEDYNCDDFTLEFSDDSLFEIVSKSVEERTFVIKALKKGKGNIRMIPTPRSDLANSTMEIEVW